MCLGLCGQRDGQLRAEETLESLWEGDGVGWGECNCTDPMTQVLRRKVLEGWFPGPATSRAHEGHETGVRELVKVVGLRRRQWHRVVGT